MIDMLDFYLIACISTSIDQRSANVRTGNHDRRSTTMPTHLGIFVSKGYDYDL